MKRNTKTTAKKTKAPARGRKTGTAVAKAGLVRNSRLQKHESRINNMGTGKLSAKQLSSVGASVVVRAKDQVSQMVGFCLSADNDKVVIRTNKRHGSSKVVIKTIKREDIAYMIGDEGQHTMLGVIKEGEVLALPKCTVEMNGSIAIVTDLKTGDVIEIDQANPKLDVQIEFDEAAA